MTAVNFTTPVGRLVAGSLYKGQDKDAEGRPLVVKNGPQAGQPRLDFYFAIAIPNRVATRLSTVGDAVRFIEAKMTAR